MTRVAVIGVGSIAKSVHLPLLTGSECEVVGVMSRSGTTAEAVFPFIVQAAAKVQTNPMRGFARGFFAKLVPNVRKLGLLDANNGYLREKWGEAGLLEFEFADDTGSDYESYDAVAQDRAARGALGASPDVSEG